MKHLYKFILEALHSKNGGDNGKPTASEMEFFITYSINIKLIEDRNPDKSQNEIEKEAFRATAKLIYDYKINNGKDSEFYKEKLKVYQKYIKKNENEIRNYATKFWGVDNVYLLSVAPNGMKSDIVSIDENGKLDGECNIQLKKTGSFQIASPHIDSILKLIESYDDINDDEKSKIIEAIRDENHKKLENIPNNLMKKLINDFLLGQIPEFKPSYIMSFDPKTQQISLCTMDTFIKYITEDEELLNSGIEIEKSEVTMSKSRKRGGSKRKNNENGEEIKDIPKSYTCIRCKSKVSTSTIEKLSENDLEDEEIEEYDGIIYKKRKYKNNRKKYTYEKILKDGSKETISVKKYNEMKRKKGSH